MIKDALTFDVSSKIPMLRNGNDMGMKFVRVDNTKLTIINTCAFDSIFQILLAAATDDPKIQEYIIREKKMNSIFELIEYTINAGKINPKSYNLRARAIVNAMGFKLKKGIQHFRAETNVAFLYEKVFEKQVGFIKTSNCCQKEVVRSTVFADDSNIYGKDFEKNAVQIILKTAPMSCCDKKHNVEAEWTLTEIGKVIAQ